MADSLLRQQWLMHGRLTIDMINSQRSPSSAVSPAGRYPYFIKDDVTQEDELAFANRLKGSKWLTVTIL